MKEFTEWLIYLLTGAFVIAMAGAGMGLFLGVAWRGVEDYQIGGVI